MFKKILWTEQNKSAKMLITVISRVSTFGFKEYFDMEDPAVKELLKDIEEVNYRVNDEQINDDEQLARDAFSTLTLMNLNEVDQSTQDKKELTT